MFTWIQALDESIQMFVQQNLHPAKAFEAIMIVITKIGDAGLFWIALGLLLLFFKQTRKCGAAMLLVLLVEYSIGEGILKNLIQRPRPYTIFPDITTYIPELSSYSFPSGHSMSSFASATTIFQFNKKWGIAALVLATLIAFSRVYLFMHWVTDVLFGCLFGILVSVFVMWLVRYIANRIKMRHPGTEA